MKRHSAFAVCTARASHASQRGQVMALGLFLLVILSLLMFVLFSTGQATSTKQRLGNATDAAAYSAALWRARILNYDAYANRAIIANEVAIAQAATMVSYARYIEKLSKNIDTVARYVPYVSTVSAIIKEIAEIASEITQYTAEVETAARTTYIHALAASEGALAATTNGFVLSALTTEVARGTDPEFFAFVLPGALGGNFGAMTKKWSGDDRKRLKDVVLRSLDEYSTNRDDNLPNRMLCTGYLARRGATDLVRNNDRDELERWQAHDTLSLHIGCAEAVPLGWGGAEIAVNATNELDSLYQGNASSSQRSNASAYRNASDDIWSAKMYLGLASVRELDYESGAMTPNDKFPVNRLSVLGWVKSSKSIGTAQGIGAGAGRVRPVDRFGDRNPRIATVSSAEVYFRRPPKDDGKVEYASLYSPYWQARLAPTSELVRTEAIGLYELAN